MEIKEIKNEKNKVLNLYNDYVDKLISIIENYEEEVKNLNVKLELSNTEISELKINIGLIEDQLKNRNEEVNILRNEILKLEDEVYILQNMNLDKKTSLIDNLKESYLAGEEDQVEELLNEIIENIQHIEMDIIDEDMILFMYLCYFYDLLESLLGKSFKANEIYSIDKKDVMLLKILVQEEKCKLYTSIDECVQSYIRKQNNLFNRFDNNIRNKLLETIKDISYDSYEGVYSETQIDKNEKVVPNKVLVRENNNINWKLVQGLYSASKNRIYLAEDMIIVLRVKSCVEDINELYKYSNFKPQNEDVKTIFVEENRLGIDDKIDKNKSKVNVLLYNELLKYFKMDNLGQSLLHYNKIVSDKDLLKGYSLMQRITLLFIGYLIKGNTFGANRIIDAGDIGVSSETILYKRLSENREMLQYLNQYESALKLIDPDVKYMIIKKLRDIASKRNKNVNSVSTYREEFDGSNLSDESAIKKMGYSTGITREQRWNILKNKAVPKLGKSKVIGHLKFLIKMNKGKASMANAVNEWSYDVDRLENLKN